MEVSKDLIDKYRYINVEYDDWASSVLDEWTTKLQLLGFVDPKIEYSGFCCQGDGASFTCEVDVSQYIESHPHEAEYKVYEPFFSSIDAKITRISHQYSHRNTVTLELTDFNLNPYCLLTEEEQDLRYEVWEIQYANFCLVLEQLERDILETARSYMKDIYNDLENLFFDEISDTAVVDTLLASELTN